MNLLKYIILFSFTFSVEIFFKVDMSNAEGWLNGVPPSCGPPSISGTFFEWNEYQNLNEISANIWGITLDLEPGVHHEYKFGNCGWNFENIAEGSPCTITFFGSTNRFITIPEIDLELDPVLFGTCDQSNGVPYWQLVWFDEFEESNIDLSKWSYDVGTGQWGWGNDEAQYYTNNSNNSYIDNGKLIIKAINESFAGNNYTSARLVTKNKGDWTYGKIVVRAKMPTGRGTWPAIWMLPTNSIYGGWPYSGEIDIMEAVGFDHGVIHGTAHCETYNWYNGQPPLGGQIIFDDFNAEFHDYVIEWDENSIKWYVDDIQYHIYSNNNQGSATWPFDQNFHLLLNIAIGGTWGGQQGIDNSIFPVQMEVDYVRVYQHFNEPEAKDVTFLVDMQYEEIDDMGLFVLGSDTQLFGDYGEGISMTNLGVGNDIWAVTVPVLPGTYTYNFKNGQDLENTNSLIDCSVGESNYRQFVLTDENLTLGPYCFGSCGDCYELSIDDNEMIEFYKLDYLYPNPFNPKVIIGYSVYEQTELKIIIYDISGEQIEVLQNNFHAIGNHEIIWDGKNYASGIYFISIFTDRFMQTEKLMLIK
tara:strand:- start:162 stop:1916 length:1755 start_codon:yes stop_codon:yes gene_type:complete